MADDDFYRSLKSFSSFEQVVDPSVYKALPDGWYLGLSDVVDSTGAIAAGKYKSVNMAGACVISAVTNALEGASFPFVFGGDGASFAVPESAVETVREVMAASAAWVSDELDLELRVAVMPVSEARSAGHDVLVANYAASGDVGYAMFSGGGLAWAEAAMKRGEFNIEAAPSGTLLNLEGLSCRWTPLKARKGHILSLLLMPGEKGASAGFYKVVQDLLALIAGASGEAHPVPEDGPQYGWRSSGVGIEARTPGEEAHMPNKVKVWFTHVMAWVLFKTKWKMGEFDPAHYRRHVGLNTDFRKFDDGLRMTLDCDDALDSKIMVQLEAALAEGHAFYGVHRQNAALMTCIVPSILQDDHMHFLDGADGGYAEASRGLKAQIAG